MLRHIYRIHRFIRHFSSRSVGAVQKININEKSIARLPLAFRHPVPGYSYRFPNIIIFGDSANKTSITQQLCGIDGFSGASQYIQRPLIISFMQTTGKDPSTYARFGNFGGKSFKLSSVLSRLNEENEFKSELPIEMKIFSPNITRSLKIIKFPDLFFPSLHIPYLSEPHNIVIDANRMNFANLLEYINTLQQPHRTEINLDEEEAKHTITEESASFYKTNVKPYAENQNKTWMYNIIKNDPSSPEKVLYDCPDFILVHDIQWPDSKDLSKLHCLAIFKDKSLMSIRDLTQAHLPLIKQTIKNAKEIIATYILSPLDIETYFHYHPSVWQLHMHFVIRGLPDKAHKYNTDDIIKNLSIPDYYQNATLNI